MYVCIMITYSGLFSLVVINKIFSSPVLTRGSICVPPTVTYLSYRVSGSTPTAVGRSHLLARWHGTHYRISSGIQRLAQTVLGVYLKRRPTCSRVTSASSALEVLNVYALCKSTHSLTHSWLLQNLSSLFLKESVALAEMTDSGKLFQVFIIRVQKKYFLKS